MLEPAEINELQVNYKHRFLKQVITSKNCILRTSFKMGLLGCYSVMGANRRLLNKYNVDVHQVTNKWNIICEEDSETVRTGEQVRELCRMRDTCQFELGAFINRRECVHMINCTM